MLALSCSLHGSGSFAVFKLPLSRLAPLVALYLLIATSLAFAGPAAPQTWHLGVLAYRNLEQTAARWQPTVDAIEQGLPAGHKLEMQAFYHEDLDRAVAAGQLDYVFTQPEHYVLLREQYGLAALATLMPEVAGRPVTQFGGVIFAKAGRKDLRELSDVAGKRIIAVYENSFGAFRMQQWELLTHGIHLPDDVADLEFCGQPQDKAVFAVQSGQADVGFVRTGILEALAAEGRIRLDEFHILNQQSTTTFPQLRSTALYPEWPLAALRGTPEPINKALTLALLNLRPDSEAARRGQYYGFSPPGDYTPLEAVLLRLHVHPQALAGFDVNDVWHKYSLPLASLLGLLLLIALVTANRLRRDRQLIRHAADERNLLLSSLGEGVYGVSADGRCTFINPAALSMLGLRAEQVVGQAQHLLFHHHYADGRTYPAEACPIYHTLRSGQRSRGEEYFFRADGQGFPVRFDATPIHERGQVLGAVVCFQDISEERAAEEALRLAAVAFETQEGIVITDAENRILRVNQAFSQVTGYQAAEAIGQTTALLKSGRHDAAFYRKMWQALSEHGRWQGEVWNRRKNGEIYPEWLTITAVRDSNGVIRHYVAAFLDITERKQAAAQLEYMTLYDSLTGLANRRLFTDRLRQSIARQRHGFGALLFIDLDNFRHFNEMHGHAAGDALLSEIANRLRQALGDSPCIGRLGGDDFVVFSEAVAMSAPEAAARAEHLATQLLAELTSQRTSSATAHTCSASIGIVLIGEQTQHAEELLKQSEQAMYQAKENGRRSIRFFDPQLQSEVAKRLSLENEMDKAIRDGQFVLYYQPQVDGDGVICGAEALVRWQHPQRGMISPGVFIPLAESSGQIVTLGHWILAEACRQLAAWQQNPAMRSWTLAVNISPRQFHRSDFIEQVRQLLLDSGARPEGLKLELTESLLIEDVDDTVCKMTALRELGLSLSLDDFGTGYSSLSYLKRLPLSQLKIDQSFVRDLGENTNDEAIVRAIIGMATSLGLEVIAEGVETSTQRQLLQAWGCRNFQGYHFFRPIPAIQLQEIAERR